MEDKSASPTYYGTKRIEAWVEQRDGKDGYGVRYEDGHKSWIPKDVFEKAYQPVTALSFGHALIALKAGHKVARQGWNGKDMWLHLQVPDENSKMQQPYIYMSPVGGQLVPWLASQSDMLANDWLIVD